MDRYKIKSAIRSLLPLQSRLFKYALTIAFLLMVLVSCWPQALAKIPFVPSIHRDLQGNWEGEDNYITFEDSYLNTRSNDFCGRHRSHHRVVITEQTLIFSDPPARQSYRLLPSLGDLILNGEPMHLVIEGSGPIPAGMYTKGRWLYLSECSLNP